MNTQSRRRVRPTYAGIASTLALVVAVSMGGAYAADKVGSGGIKKNAIKTRHIAAAGVAGSDLRGNAVGSQHIGDGQVTTPDLADNAVTLAKLAPGVAPQALHYQFSGHNFGVSSGVNLTVPGPLTAEEVAASTWAVQLVRASGNIYPIPGTGQNGASLYRVLVYQQSGVANLSIGLVSGAGEDYATIRVVRIVPTQTQVVP